MRGPWKSLRTPGWVCFTVFVWAGAITMVLLGRWQLVVSDSKHFDLQNFGYALQWWAFSAAFVIFWAKVLRDTIRGRKADNRTRDGRVVTASGSDLVLRSTASPAVAAGPAYLATGATDDGEPTVYRGYVMPSSATHPDRSDDDRMRASYNDYLWQLAMADEVRPERGLTAHAPQAEHQPDETLAADTASRQRMLDDGDPAQP